MLAKILIGSGILIMIVSAFVAAQGIMRSFAGIENAARSVEALAPGMNQAIFASIGFGVGTFIVVIGLIRFVNDRKKR